MSDVSDTKEVKPPRDLKQLVRGEVEDVVAELEAPPRDEPTPQLQQVSPRLPPVPHPLGPDLLTQQHVPPEIADGTPHTEPSEPTAAPPCLGPGRLRISAPPLASRRQRLGLVGPQDERPERGREEREILPDARRRDV